MTKTGSLTLDDYIRAIAARNSTPGGGSVAAVNAAEGCALVAMVARFTKDDMTEVAERADGSCQQLLQLSDADEAAFDGVMKAYRGDADLEAALRLAAEVPLQVLAVIRQHLPDLGILVEEGNPNLITDVGIAAGLFRTAMESCRLNVLINTASMQDKGAIPAFNQRSLEADVANCDHISSIILKKLT